MAEEFEEGADHPGADEMLSRQWIERAKASDATTAWNHLEDRYRSRLHALARVRLGTKVLRFASDADIVQEAWAKVFPLVRDFDYRGPDSFYRLLAKKVCEIAMDQGKRANVREKEAQASPEPLEAVHADLTTPTQAAQLRSRAELLADHLSDPRLPRPYADILVARYLEDLPVSELAAARAVRPELIHDWLRRARDRYRELFGHSWEAMI